MIGSPKRRSTLRSRPPGQSGRVVADINTIGKISQRFIGAVVDRARRPSVIGAGLTELGAQTLYVRVRSGTGRSALARA